MTEETLKHHIYNALTEKESYEDLTMYLTQYLSNESEDNTMKILDTSKEDIQVVIATIKENLQYFNNVVITDVEMCEQLNELQDTLSSICSLLERYSYKSYNVTCLIDYYLPTTKKLVMEYEQIDTSNTVTSEMKAIQNKILKSFPEINLGLKTLLSAMYEDDNLDISSDIDTMKQVMQLNGLLNKDNT